MKSTQVRYQLFFSDEKVCDSFKIKSRIKYTTAEANQVFDMKLLSDPEFQRHIRDTGNFFDVCVSPLSKK
jgi:hypothetical protein